MSETGEKVSGRRINWQAVAAFLTIVALFVSLVKWGVQIDARIGAVQESFSITKDSIHDEIGQIRTENARQFDSVNTAIADGNMQREKATDRLEGRVEALNETITRFLMQSIPLDRKASYAGAGPPGGADNPDRR